MAGAHDPRGAVDVGSNIALRGDDGLARVDADPYADRPVGKVALGGTGRGDRIGGARERDEERVALRVHLNAAVPRERVAQHGPVLRKHVCVLLSDLLQQAGRALDVCEEKGDRAGWQRLHMHMMTSLPAR